MKLINLHLDPGFDSMVDDLRLLTIYSNIDMAFGSSELSNRIADQLYSGLDSAVCWQRSRTLRNCINPN